MFEDSASRNGFVAFALDFVSLAKAYPVTALVYLGSVPFWVYTWKKGLPTGTLHLFPLHAYFLTGVFCIENPLRVVRRNLREKWFWTATMCGLLPHTAILIGLYYWDRTIPGRFTFFSNPFASRLLIALLLELVMLNPIFRYFRPSATPVG